MKSKNFTKKHLAINLSKTTGLSKSYSSSLIDDYISIIIEEIQKNKFILKNIGSFKIRRKKERIGRNPKTKEEHIISGRNSLTFTASERILEFLNSGK